MPSDFLYLSGHVRSSHTLVEFTDNRLLALFSELPLDGSHLLAEDKLALPLRHLRLHFRLNLVADLDDLKFARHNESQLGQARLDLQHFEQLLLLGHRDVEVPSDKIT